MLGARSAAKGASMADATFKVTDGSFSAYVAQSKAASAPGMLVIQEIFGVNQVMRDLCDGLARQGYVAMCPDLFWRQEPGIQITDKTDAEWQRAFELFKGFDQDKGAQDLVASLAHLRKLPGCNGKAGSVGYCLGGKLAFLMATRSNSDCNVSYYGVGIEGALGEANKIQKPLLMHIAAEDRFVPKEAQGKIKQALAANGNVTIHVYEGTDHAFARAGGAHWNAAAAQLANDRTAAFLKKHLF
jgi:carboxymethylenebutenolidase